MKKIIVTFVLSTFLLMGCSSTNEKSSANFSDEMKIPYTVNLHEYGSDSVERTADHENSPYFVSNDYYNMVDSDSLSIISKFKTQQQTSEWSCGISAIMMTMEHYDMLGDNNEENLAMQRSNGMKEEATSLKDIVKILENNGFDTDSTYDYTPEQLAEYMTLEKIEETVKADKPIIIAWNDWGGHWQVIIGYDNMGTSQTQADDVVIVADSYDTTDHNQDGYGVYPAERFFYNWTMFDFFSANYGIDEREKLFCIPTPKSN